MKICDRCFAESDKKEPVQSTVTLQLIPSEEIFHLCLSCAEKVRDMITGAKHGNE